MFDVPAKLPPIMAASALEIKTSYERVIESEAAHTSPDRQSAQYVFGWNDAIELAAIIAEKYKRDASFNDSIIGALEHNSPS